jgi:hypothetical protein
VYKDVKVDGVSKYYAYFEQSEKGKFLQKIKKGPPVKKEVKKQKINKDTYAEVFFSTTFLRDSEVENYSDLLKKIIRIQGKPLPNPINESIFEKSMLPIVKSTSKEKGALSKSEKIQKIKVNIILT